MWTEMHSWWGMQDRATNIGPCSFVLSQSAQWQGDTRFLFATLEQWVSHWVSHCLVRGCKYTTTAASDLLDALFCHIMDTYKDVYNEGEWHNLVDMVKGGNHVKPNTQYWPPTSHVGELQCPVAVTKPTTAQLLSPIVAARWAARETFHLLVASRRRQYRRAQCKDSKSVEHSSSATKGATKAPTEPGTQDALRVSGRVDKVLPLH